MTFMRSALSPRGALIALAVAGAAVALVISLGDEASARGECPARTLCVYEQDSGGGQVVEISRKGISNKLFKKMDNEASSFINNRNRRAYLYDGKDGKGTWVCLNPTASAPSLGAYLFNDMASSSKNAKSKKDCGT